MTKREICERLLAIWEMEPYKNTAEAIKHLLLDLAAPVEENSSLSYSTVVECPSCHKRTKIGDLLYDKKEYYCPRCNFLFGELENESTPETEEEKDDEL